MGFILAQHDWVGKKDLEVGRREKTGSTQGWTQVQSDLSREYNKCRFNPRCQDTKEYNCW